MRDIRRIVFSKDELLCAFQAFARKTPEFLPEGKLLSCTPTISTEKGSEIVIKMETPQKEQTELHYRDADVLQPLILFCLENNVMLPRQGRKSFLVLEEDATMIVDLNLEFDLCALEAPMRSEDIGKLP
jgi:hypothetical protein